MIGRILRDRYRIDELVGEGSTSRVYRGHDLRLARDVIIKMLRAEHMQHPATAEAFRSEAVHGARLADPRIVRTYDLDTCDGQPFIVQEHVQGESLDRLLARGPAPTVPQALRTAIDILKALEHAHAHGILHRDLKPHNVLCDWRQKILLTDFGLATALRPETLSQSASMVGTPHYFSPEQAQGQALTVASDLYSVGVILYQMLTGRVPFDAENPIAVALKHVQQAPPSLASQGLSVPPELEAAVQRALKKAPDERFSSARDFIIALQPILAALETPLRGLTPRPSARPGELGDGAAPSTSLLDPAPAVEALPPPTAPPLLASPPRSGLWARLAAAAVLLTVATIAVLVMQVYGKMAEIEVPDLRGSAEDLARTRLERAGLRLVVSETRYDERIAPGTILDQLPRATVRVGPGQAVSVVLSKGRQVVQVPDLAHLDRQASRKLLEDLGLVARFSEGYSRTVDLGQVMGQSPLGGTSVPLQSAVKIQISKGPPLVKVPDLMGLGQAMALERAERAGFTFTVSSTRPDTYCPRGTVCGQTPTAGSQLALGQPVAVIVSSGQETHKAPRLVGLTLDEARQAARRSQFDIAVDAGGSDGGARVQEQDPAAGVELPSGTRIHLRLEPTPTPEEPRDVKVPSTISLTLEAAQALLEEHGLSCGSVTRTVSDVVAPGNVLRQSPPEGASVRRGSAIDLIIAQPKD